MSDSSSKSKLSRREFITRSSMAAGLMLGTPAFLKGKQAIGGAPAGDEIRVAFIGCGKQQEVLFHAMNNLPGIRYVAVCDIMTDRLGAAAGRIRNLQGEMPQRYIDAEEMLSKETDLDAVFVSTPDFWHSPHTVMALEAGCHVYCEKMMSHTIEGARAMVHAMERTGKLCQIGHQRRSNPRYTFVLNELIRQHNVFGQIVNVNAQWNRALSSSQDIVSRPTILPDAAALRKYGFNEGADHELSLEELRHRFLNWRFYSALSGGPISDLGAHQISIFSWFLDAKPKSVMASGGRSFFKNREHFDNVMCVFDYDTPHGDARAFYQVLTTTSAGGGYYEAFMGTEGTMEISEREAFTNIWKESGSDDAKWNEMVSRGFLKKGAAGVAAGGDDAIASYESAPPDRYELPGGLSQPPHQPHVLNFFDAIRGKAELNCDARVAFESEAPIYWVNPSATARQPIHFTNEHLSV